MAVDDMAATAPSATPACQPTPSMRAAHTASAAVATTCAPPRPNTMRRMVESFARLNSSPIENIRKTTPNSARRCVSSGLAAMLSACGPSASPVAR